MSDLLDCLRRTALAHADGQGVARLPVPGLSTITATTPGPLVYDISCPMVVLVAQGGKRVSFGHRAVDFGAGESLLITADVPTTSQITAADARHPYHSFVLHLDRALITALLADMDEPGGPTRTGAASSPVVVDATDADVRDCAVRLLRLVERPASLHVLQQGLLRELHHWLLLGRHGAAIRELGMVNAHAQRIGRAVAAIRAEYAAPLRIEALATLADMSLSTFHTHFRAVTSLTPLQFQKQLRLVEARRLIRDEGAMAKRAAHAVGYESVTQFTREYGRLFGVPPGRDRPAVAAPARRPATPR